MIRGYFELAEKVLIVIGALIPEECEDKWEVSSDARCNIELGF